MHRVGILDSLDMVRGYSLFGDGKGSFAACGPGTEPPLSGGGGTTVCLLRDGAAPRMQDTFTLAVCRLVHHLVLFGFMNHPIASVLASPEIEGLDRYAGRLEALAGNLVKTATDKESAVAAVRTGLRA